MSSGHERYINKYYYYTYYNYYYHYLNSTLCQKSENTAIFLRDKGYVVGRAYCRLNYIVFYLSRGGWAHSPILIFFSPRGQQVGLKIFAFGYENPPPFY